MSKLRNVDMCCGQIADKAELIKKYNELEVKAAYYDAIMELCAINPMLLSMIREGIKKCTTKSEFH
tara:strand:- start:2313 stop:2510 length:198 start_codon:yes stop_codon:yes gene_type:complete